jgi:hypothetical protein
LSASNISVAIKLSDAEKRDYTPSEIEQILNSAKKEALEKRIESLPGKHCVTSETFDYLGLPMRLLRGSVEDLMMPDSGPLRRPANLVWSLLNSWCIAADADLSSIYVGGSREFISDILENPTIESFEVDRTQDVTWDSDTVNPLPD